jgi:hypothetical protein
MGGSAEAAITEDSAMGKVLIVVGALATLAVGILAADQATSRENQRADDTTPCREAPTRGWSGASHDGRIYPLAEACRQEWRRAHGTHLIPDSYRGPSNASIDVILRDPVGTGGRNIGSWR